MSYARNTRVSEDRSRQEIERLLMKYGADEFGYFTRKHQAAVCFVYCGLRIQMTIDLPDRDSDRFHKTPVRGNSRNESSAFDAWQAEVRRLWRALTLAIKAKLVFINEGGTTFENEFMPYVVCNDGKTIGQKMSPILQKAIKQGGQVPAMLQLTAG